MYILFPGRHHLLTNYQFNYLYKHIKTGEKKIEGIIFAVTSANHENTRRNPLPFYLRAMAISDFSKELGVKSYIFGIDDVGHLNNFSDYILKKINHESGGKLVLTKENTLILCSTPVLLMFEKEGFEILPCELENKSKWSYKTKLPWNIVEDIANPINSRLNDISIIEYIHPSSVKIWELYGYDKKVKTLFSDVVIGEDGDITKTRDYTSYVAQMDEIAKLKYEETSAYIKPGRIGDIGCAVGSWIKLACEDTKFRECDFYGIEVAKKLYDICIQRKHNGEFENPFVFFSQKNAITENAFDKNSMDTIFTSSLTHEIESYGGRDDLLSFIKRRYEELKIGGVWINRDVTGPSSDKLVYMKLNKDDGINKDINKTFNSSSKLQNHLDSLSTMSKFIRFASDFRKKYSYTLEYEVKEKEGEEHVCLKLSDAYEFLSKKDYTDNWESEMNETFCFWSFDDWKDNLISCGFKVDEKSYSYTNNWIVENRFIGKAQIYEKSDKKLLPLKWQDTGMILIATKI
jgi:hypothetical protein